MTMGNKHTPGPWRIGNKWNSVVAESITGYDDEGTIDAYGGHLVCESAKLPANARLIAAAPDMLDALEWCVNALEYDYRGSADDYEIPQSVRAAIAKARGQ